MPNEQQVDIGVIYILSLNNSLFLLDLPIQYSTLLEEFYKVKDNIDIYTDVRGGINNHWKIIRHTFPYATDIIKGLNLENYDVRPRFYTLDKNTTLSPHTDLETQCAVNILLSQNNAPITIENVNYEYKQALINVQLMHGVNNFDEDRIIFKLSIMNLSFTDAKSIIKASPLYNQMLHQ